MHVLLDNNLDVALEAELGPHTVTTVRALGWRELSNGALLSAAEQEFDALVTGDKNLPYQTNVKAKNIAVFVLNTP